MRKQEEEKRKLRMLKKEQKNDPHNRNTESKYMYTNHIFLSYFFMAQSFYFQFSVFYFARSKKFGRDRDRDRSMI